MSIFDYNDIQIPDCSFRISPSSISKFFDYPSVWYKDNILGQKEFTASTSTVLGTVVHAFAESYAKGLDLSREEAEAFITQSAKSQPIGSDPILIQDIKDAYPEMAMRLINDYIRKNKPTVVEEQIYAKVLDDIYVGGSCDAVTYNSTSGIVQDYKTYNSTTKPKSIPFGYKIQCLAYAWIYKQKSIPIDRIRIIYVNRPIDTRSISEKTGKPIGKITPPEVTVLTEVITPDDWELIENTLKLIAETVQYVRQHPDTAHLLFKSYKLKG